MQQAPSAQLTCAQAPAGELLARSSLACSFANCFRDTPLKELLLAPQRKRSSTPDPACEANAEDTVRYRLCAFFLAHPVLPSVHARSARVGIGERESRRAWGQQLVVRGQLHLPSGKLVMRVARVGPKRARCLNWKGTSFHVVLELEHVKPVDQRSAIRKADAVLPAFARAGQRHDTLKRVAQRGRCRLLFLASG